MTKVRAAPLWQTLWQCLSLAIWRLWDEYVKLMNVLGLRDIQREKMIWLFVFKCHLCQYAWEHLRSFGIHSCCFCHLLCVCELLKLWVWLSLLLWDVSSKKIKSPNFLPVTLSSLSVSHCLLYKVTCLPATLIDSKCSDARGVNTHKVSLAFTCQLTLRTLCGSVCACVFVCVCTETFLKAELCPIQDKRRWQELSFEMH